mgnify:CR=1 FL=1|jgi:hypothetical protein
MSEFFNSEIVREEITEINELQEKIFGSLMTFSGMDHEDQIEHVDILITLLEKQRLMYTRLSLSDDPAAIKMREELKKSVSLMGFPPNTSMQTLFDKMGESIQLLKQSIDN